MNVSLPGNVEEKGGGRDRDKSCEWQKSRGMKM